MADKTASSGALKKDGEWVQTIIVAAVTSVIGAISSGILSAFIMHVSVLVLAVVVVVLAVVGGALFVVRHFGVKVKGQWIVLGIVLAVLVAGAAGLGVWIGRATASSPNGGPKPPPPTPTVSIVTPESIVDCQSSGAQCQFTVTGRSAGVSSDLQIYILVFPVHPAGGGWFVQSPPASIEGNGDWNQVPSDIGAPAYPAKGGDKLQIEAVLVRVGATYDGTALGDLASQGTSIKDPRQITGLVGQSDLVSLQVQR